MKPKKELNLMYIGSTFFICILKNITEVTNETVTKVNKKINFVNKIK